MGLSFDLLALGLGDMTVLTVGALSWRQNYHSGSARTFFFTTLTFAFWLTANYFSLRPSNMAAITLYTHLSYMGGVWLLIAAWYFCYHFPIERKPPWQTQALFVVVFITGSLFGFSRLVVSRVEQKPDQFLISPGPAYWLYGALLAVLAIAAMLTLRRNYMASDRLQQNQIRYAAFGIGAGASICIFFNVVLVLFDPRWGSPLVNLFITLLIVTFLGYGMIRHRYADVHRLASWLFTYVLCYGLIAGLLLIANWWLGRVYPDSTHAQTAGLLIAASGLIFVIQPVKRRLKRWGDQLLNVGWYDSQAFLNSIGIMLAGERHFSPLVKNSLESICTTLRTTAGELIVIGEDGRRHVEQFGDWLNRYPVPSLGELGQAKGIVIIDELPADNPMLPLYAPYGIRISVPLETRGRLVGYLLLGIKQSGDIFSEQDISLLHILASELAVALVSALSYEQVSQFNVTLQQEVATATADLRQAHAKLQLDDRMKTEFIILTSHHLRTPISIFKGYISLLQETQLSVEQRKLLDAMKTGTDRLNQFTEDLLAIDSIIAGKQMVLEPVSANVIIAPLIKEAKDRAKTKHLEFKADLALENVVINANLLRLSGAIRNILDNAFKFTEKGQVTFSADLEGEQLKIIVTDTGIGITADELPNLFTQFHRATSNQRYNYDYEGEGIGLYLTNLVVKEHGGHITVTSELDHGSTFVITLPAKRQIKR